MLGFTPTLGQVRVATVDMFSYHITLHILKCMVCCVVNFVSVDLHVEIMMALEEQFSISLDEKGDEKIGIVQDVVDMI